MEIISKHMLKDLHAEIHSTHNLLPIEYYEWTNITIGIGVFMQ